MKEFASKIDTWLMSVIVVTVLVSMGAAILSLMIGGLIGCLSALLIAVVGAVLPVWLLLSTKYVVNNESLIVRSGPFSWLIPVGVISSVQETQNSLSSPALSLDRLRISYGESKSIMVSPKDKRQFRAAIGHPES